MSNIPSQSILTTGDSVGRRRCATDMLVNQECLFINSITDTIFGFSGELLDESSMKT